MGSMTNPLKDVYRRFFPSVHLIGMRQFRSFAIDESYVGDMLDAVTVSMTLVCVVTMQLMIMAVLVEI